MASVLKVDTLTGVTTAGSIAITGEGGSNTMQLQQGVAKAWSNYDQRSTLSHTSSFNRSSETDEGSGNIKITLASAMSDATYVVTGLGHYVDSTENDLVPAIGLRRGVAKTSTTYETQTATATWNGTAGADVDAVMTVVHGDLA